MDFRDALKPFEDVTEDKLREAMSKIAEPTLIQLAGGPAAGRYACGICRAFTAGWYKNQNGWDRSNPSHIVFCYHEVPKIYMRVAEDQWSGKLAEDVYARCQTTYRIAQEVVEQMMPTSRK